MMHRLLHALKIAVLLPALVALPDSSTAAEPFSLLIEVEDYAERTPDDGTFAVATREMAASGRRSLARFVEGHVTYRFRVPTDGTYFGWLRYGSKNDLTIGVALDPQGEPKFKAARLTATGGYIGPDVWDWAPIFEARLTAGEHTLAIRSASMRPDCFVISTRGDKPDDGIIKKEFTVKLDSEIRALVDRPLVEVSPDWLAGAADYRLPDWYEAHRVHAHTRLSLRHLDQDVFFRAAEGFRQMGAKVFARHIKTGSEGAWWPSRLGAVDERIGDRNVAKTIIDNAHAQGQRIIVYHRHMEDAAMAAEHPDWVCRDWRGEPLSSKRGAYMCLNSGYADYLLARSLELVDLGADAFFYDEVHMPKTGCWCENCRTRFRETTGLDHPPRSDPEDPVWHKLVDFKNLTIEQAFLRWRRALHERNPELVMLIGSNTWPMTSDRHTTNRLYRIADSMKTEFSLPARSPSSALLPPGAEMAPFERDAKLAFGYTLARDAADGRPAHIWAHGLLDEASALYAAAGMITHGSIANLDVAEDTIPNMTFAKAFDLGDRVSPAFAGSRPVRFAALHYSELARDRHVIQPSMAWEQVLYPVYGAYLTLLRDRVPVGIVTDSQLEDGLLDGYRVLFLPAPEALTDRMRAAVERFQSAGGIVVHQQADWRWHTPDGQEDAMAAFRESVAQRAPAPPVQVVGGPEKMHAVSFVHRAARRLTVSLANDFSWVYTGRAPAADQFEELTRTPPPCRDVTILLRTSLSEPKVTEVVTGRQLRAAPTPEGLEIVVPEFEQMAVIVVSY